jgi:hypothetical protein
LKRKAGSRQAGRQAVPYLLLLPTYHKFGRNQQKEKAGNISNIGIVSRLVYIYVCSSQNVGKLQLGCWCEVCTSVSSKEPIWLFDF